jgi:hypothetical protein
MITKREISLNSTVLQGEGNIECEMGKEKVMLNVQNGKYYNLGETGGEIWNLIKYPIKVSDLINTLLEGFDVEREKCESDVLALLEHLYEEKLLQVDNEL